MKYLESFVELVRLDDGRDGAGIVGRIAVAAGRRPWVSGDGTDRKRVGRDAPESGGDAADRIEMREIPTP